MKRLFAPFFILLALLLAACDSGGGSNNESAVATLVAAALQTNEAANPPVVETAAPLTGFVEGGMCFPSSAIPDMTVYLQLVGSPQVTEVPIAFNQTSYRAEVPVGSYIAYAWLPDFTSGGSYSQAVPCGLDVSCTDHSLIVFDVTGGETTSGVDMCDWYGEPGDLPYPPGVQPPDTGGNSGGSTGGNTSGGAVSSGGPSGTSATTGAISGALSFPSEGIPATMVVAWNLTTGTYSYVITASGSGGYQISNLTPGPYQVVAYASGMAGGYTPAVPCGLSVSCTDHGLATVQVVAGEVTFGVDPQDWYAPEGSFPAEPSP